MTKSTAKTEIERLPAEAVEVLIVANPKAGAGPGHERVERLVAALRRQRLEPRIVVDLAGVADLAAERQGAGRLRAVVAAGGDGTVAELINRLSADVPLAIFPLGTENLLARYIDMPREPEETAEVIAAGAVIRHDIGSASGRLFALMIVCGFDAEEVPWLHDARRGHISRWTYMKPLWEAIRNYEFPEIRIVCEPGEPEERVIRARFAFVINIPRYAMGLQIAPGAVRDDGLLDLCALERGSFFAGLRYFIHILFRNHPRLPDCTMVKARRFRIESDRPVPYELDGDPGGYLPLEVEVLPGRLKLIAPPGWIERQKHQPET